MESVIRAAPERVFAFHELPDALMRLTPEWERGHVIAPPASLRVGERTILRIRVLGIFRMLSIAEHTRYEPPRLFEDRLVSGPFRRWVHRHVIVPHDRGAVLRDEIEYELPGGRLGRLFDPLFVRPRLVRLFEYRHRVTREWCEDAPDRDAPVIDVLRD